MHAALCGPLTSAGPRLHAQSQPRNTVSYHATRLFAAGQADLPPTQPAPAPGLNFSTLGPDSINRNQLGARVSSGIPWNMRSLNPNAGAEQAALTPPRLLEALQYLSATKRQPSPAQLLDLLQLAVPLVPTLTPVELVTALRSLAGLTVPTPSEFLLPALVILQQHMAALNLQQLSALSVALINLQVCQVMETPVEGPGLQQGSPGVSSSSGQEDGSAAPNSRSSSSSSRRQEDESAAAEAALRRVLQPPKAVAPGSEVPALDVLPGSWLQAYLEATQQQLTAAAHQRLGAAAVEELLQEVAALSVAEAAAASSGGSSSGHSSSSSTSEVSAGTAPDLTPAAAAAAAAAAGGGSTGSVVQPRLAQVAALALLPAEAGVVPPPAWCRLLCALAVGLWSQATAQQVVQLLGSFARWRQPPSLEVLQACLDHFQEECLLYDAEQLQGVLQALETLALMPATGPWRDSCQQVAGNLTARGFMTPELRSLLEVVVGQEALCK